ncbi:MAG: thiamine biosynthesis lipoprotein, partial [bacterium]
MILEGNHMVLNMLNIKKGSFICLFFVFLFYGCNPSSDDNVSENKLAGNALGTTYHITYLGNEIEGLQLGIDSIIVSFNYGLSTYDSNSFISQFNNNIPVLKGMLKPGYEHLQIMIDKSKVVHQATGGA